MSEQTKSSETKKRYKAAIIGFGRMGIRHFSAYQMAGVEVVAICDQDETKATQIINEHPNIHFYTDPLSLFETEKNEVDIVSIVTNSATHAPLTIQAAEAGIKNILCEKPMATNLADAKKMIDACKSNGSLLAINYYRHTSPNHLKLKKSIKENLIGPVRHIYYQNGSTGIGNMGTVFIDNMCFYAESDCEWVIGFVDKTGTPSPRGPQFVDPGGYGLIHFKNGVRAFLDISEDTGVGHFCNIVGSYGRVVIDELSDNWEISARNEEDKSKPLTLYVLPMQVTPFELEHKWDVVLLTSYTISAILSGSSSICTGEEAYQALEIGVALHISDKQNNCQIKLPLKGEFLNLEIPFA